MRRLRENAVLRGMVRETQLTLDDLVMPLFAVEGLARKEEVSRRGSGAGRWTRWRKSAPVGPSDSKR
jgi:delta-aminolevulinic acid dehydratase/porphobilinogen synthase